MPEDDQDPTVNPCLTPQKDNFGPVAAGRDEPVQLRLWLCKTSARVVVTLDRLDLPGSGSPPLIDQNAPPPNPVPVSLPSLAPGRYLLSWSYFVTSDEWMVVAEVLVGGVVRFRHTKSHQSDKPINHDATVVEVLP